MPKDEENSNKKKIYNIELPYNKGGTLDEIRNGSLFDQLKSVVQGHKIEKILSSLTQLLIDSLMEDTFSENRNVHHKYEKGLSDEDFEKLNIIIESNVFCDQFPKLKEIIISHIESVALKTIASKIKYLTDKYGENFQDNLEVKFNIEERIGRKMK